MPKRTYVPTEADKLTGRRVRAIRNRRGETLKQTVDGSRFGRDASTLAAVERGERQLTELEATRLAAHFGTTPAMLFNPPVSTEQAWLGNDKPTALFPVPDLVNDPLPNFDTRFAAAEANIVAISRDNPLTPEQYRDQVWIPYLESRYATDLKQTG